MGRDIYDTDKAIEYIVGRIMDSPDILEVNKQIISDFKKECEFNRLSKCRVSHYLNRLIKLGKWAGKSFKDFDRQDIRDMIHRIETGTFRRNNERIPFSEGTKNEFYLTLKKLFQIIYGYSWRSKKFPEIVDDIVIGKKNSKSYLPEEILKEKEIERLIESTDHIRDKALVSVLYESGCRIGELLPIKIKHIEFDMKGAFLRVSGKTGQRRVRVVDSVDLLHSWLKIHPNNDDPESFVWINIGVRNKGELLRYDAFTRMLKRLSKRAGIKKRVNPHAFRHARATHLAPKLTEATMKRHFGWTASSKMASVYVHMSGKDTDREIMKLYEKGELVKCVKCQAENDSNLSYCNECQWPLDMNIARKKQERELGNLITPEIFEKMVEEKVRQVLSGVCIKVNQKI